MDELKKLDSWIAKAPAQKIGPGMYHFPARSLTPAEKKQKDQQRGAFKQKLAEAARMLDEQEAKTPWGLKKAALEKELAG